MDATDVFYPADCRAILRLRLPDPEPLITAPASLISSRSQSPIQHKVPRGCKAGWGGRCTGCNHSHYQSHQGGQTYTLRSQRHAAR